MFPIFVENSRVPILLSRLAPIDIGAITLGPLVLSRGEITETTRTHEKIHWQQYKECLIVGFVILYFAFYIINRIKGMKGPEAYANIPFEREAYDNQDDPSYPEVRPVFGWA